MKEIGKKLIFYLSFCALGLFTSEASSFNIPHALWVPPLYPAYGLLWIFFLDGLMRCSERRFRCWYLFGVLVGLITESYLAKVVFYGLSPDAFRILGFAPAPALFLVLFFHPLYSFLLPSYVAARLLHLPFPVRKRWTTDAAILAAPLLLGPSIHTALIKRDWALGPSLGRYGLSAAALVVLVLALRLVGEVRDVRLSKRERIALAAITVMAYVLYFVYGTNRAHGVTAYPPVGALTVVSALVAAIILLLTASLGRNRQPREPVGFSASSMGVAGFFAWLGWHLLAIVAPTTLLVALLPSPFMPALVLLFLLGLALGIPAFLWSFTSLARSRFART